MREENMKDEELGDNIFISFSGGRTSAYMAIWIKENYPDKNLITMFSNTGQEHERTYEFVNEMDKRYDLNVIWVEADIHPDRALATGYKIVDYETACRDGRLFEDMVKRYGIPNQGSPFCTRELKLKPMTKCIKDLIGKDYTTAIGIRSDEMDRINSNYEKLRYWYPLAWNGITKQKVNEFWREQDFDLGLEDFQGNCTWCWKKSFPKHFKMIQSDPSVYDVPKYLEEKYRINNIPSQKRYGKKQSFFRNYNTAVDIMKAYEEDKLEALTKKDIKEGYDNSCKEECSPFNAELVDAVTDYKKKREKDE